MAKKTLLSAKARKILTVTTILWFVMVLMLITGLGIEHATRVVPDFVKVTKTLELPPADHTGSHAKEEFHHYRAEFIAAKYLTVEPIEIGDETIPAQTVVNKLLFDRLVALPYTQELKLRDPKELRNLTGQKLKAREDLHRLDLEPADKVGDEAPIPIVAKGEEIHLEQMEALADHGWVGLEIPVKGEDKIVGVNLTLPFVAINFLFLVSILYGILWEPILNVLDERAEKIRVDLETAETDRTEASELRTEYESQIGKISQERVSQVERGKREGHEERERIVGEARAEAVKIVESAKAEIEAATEKAKKELMAQISTFSTTMATEILRREIKPDDHKAMVDQFVAKMNDTQLN